MKRWALMSLVVVLVVAFQCTAENFSLMTWNVRGYPENASCPKRRVWFTNTIAGIDADILCIQEINGTAQDFIQREYVTSGFLTDTSDSKDNAVFFSSEVVARNTSDPSDFQHPAQCAFFQIAGLTGYVITVHLTCTDIAQRVNERISLAEVVADYLALDPDLIIAGDFNTTGSAGDTIKGLALFTGMVWIQPDNYCCEGTTYSGAVYDHILVSPAIAAAWDISSTIRTFTDEAMSQAVSDHRPVYATFNKKGTGSVTPPINRALPPATAPCDCYNGDALNCGDFPCQSVAQDCFDYCMELTGQDVHRLDGDNDGEACESLRKTCP